ncbi:MAG: hypothetical protein RLZZ618_853 [Pseudomonadota bacterium]|jgi:hypothetical protein
MRALQIHAGPRARQALAERGLSPGDVRAVPGAAGGPKGLVLNPLDQYLFGDWLPRGGHTVHLLGASIGAWRMASACLSDPAQGLKQMADDYIGQEYAPPEGGKLTASMISEAFGAGLVTHFGGREAEILSHPRYRLHVFTSRGRHVLRREGRAFSKITTPLGYLGAFATNAVSRRAMGAWLERVVFSDTRDEIPLRLHDYRTHAAHLTPENLRLSVLASCSIPFWLDAVHNIPGGPRGAYWDGGITDYHLHLNYASMTDGLVLYPHFQQAIVPGWLDKALKHRHRSSPFLSNVIVVSPSAEWIATLPKAKLPDRHDFKAYGHDVRARMKAWNVAVAESQRLRDEFAALVESGRPIEALPL